jgi:hypothetical protein
MPAPTIEPITIAISEESGSFCPAVEDAEGADDAVEDVIFLPFIYLPGRTGQTITGAGIIGRWRGKIQSIDCLDRN